MALLKHLSTVDRLFNLRELLSDLRAGGAEGQTKKFHLGLTEAQYLDYRPLLVQTNTPEMGLGAVLSHEFDGEVCAGMQLWNERHWLVSGWWKS